ncbi:MAG: hypothetical protein AABX12_02520 [Nanoarchaeota archaeon]
MVRKSIIKIIKEIKVLLEKERELSTRQISIKTRSQWRTANKALEVLVFLDVIKKRKNKETDRVEILYSLKDCN